MSLGLIRKGWHKHAKVAFGDISGYHCCIATLEVWRQLCSQGCAVSAGFMFTGAAVVSGAGDGNTGMLEGLIIEKLNGWDIEKRYQRHMKLQPCCLCLCVLQ